MTFNECVIYCAGQKELVREFNRLWGAELGVDSRTPIDVSIDKACGYEPPLATEKDMNAFIDFVWKYIYSRIDWEGNT